MEQNYKYKVFPTQYVKGFVPTFCKTMECAMVVRRRMTDQTGIEWRVRALS